MYQSRTILALALANSVSALLLPANPGRVAKVHMAATEPVAPAVTKAFPHPAYDGLVLPYETGGTNDNLNNKVNGEVSPFLANIGGGSPALAALGVPISFKGVFMKEIVDKGLPKLDRNSLDALQDYVKSQLDLQNHAAVPGLADMPEGYKFFGGDDFAAQLCVLLESNPFYAASLTPRAGGGFEIINYVCRAHWVEPRARRPHRGWLAMLPLLLTPFEPCLVDRIRSPRTRRTTSRSCARWVARGLR